MTCVCPCFNKFANRKLYILKYHESKKLVLDSHDFPLGSFYYEHTHISQLRLKSWKIFLIIIKIIKIAKVPITPKMISYIEVNQKWEIHVVNR